jgi:hypothetical protein
MIIHQPEIVFVDDEVRLQTRVETRAADSGLPEFLWFSYPRHYAGMLSTRGDGPLAALILLATVLGEDLECRAEISPRLLYNLDQYQRVFHLWEPKVHKLVDVRAEKVSPPPAAYPQAGFAAAFSGGVDSLFTLKQALTPSLQHPQRQLKYGLFMQGSPDLPLIYTQKFEQLVQKYSVLAQELRIELIPVRTNLMEFVANRISLKAMLEAPLAGASLGLSPILTGLLVPTGRPYEQYHYLTANTLTTYLMATETFEMVCNGAGFTRLEKTLAISDWAPAQKNLRVCFGWNHPTSMNCSNCSKCLRTRMDLNVIGRLDQVTTLKSPFTVKDVLLWGRWMDTSYGWEKDLLLYAWKQRKEMVPAILLGMLIGFPRDWLRKNLPGWVKKPIFRLTAEKDPHSVFKKNADTGEGKRI